jgi:2-oxoglutarate dehydrogenase complex dehydrogenase (E1) component-like enzyme
VEDALHRYVVRMAGRPVKFKEVDAIKRLQKAIESAIENTTNEVARGVDPDTTGSARKAELQSIKTAALDARELIVEHQKLTTMLEELKESNSNTTEIDWSGGFAEEFSGG